MNSSGFTKRFRDIKTVDDISLRLAPGVWGLLGANGAGKTTLMRILAGIVHPTSGAVTYDGIPIAALGQRYRDIFGYLPQEFGFYPEFTVQDYLEYVAVLKGLNAADSKRKIHELLEQLTLTQVRRKKCLSVFHRQPYSHPAGCPRRQCVTNPGKHRATPGPLKLGCSRE